MKGNIGHLEGGSGIAGLIKTVMVLEKGIIPPNANFQTINPSIDAEFFNLKVSAASLNLTVCTDATLNPVSDHEDTLAHYWLAESLGGFIRLWWFQFSCHP